MVTGANDLRFDTDLLDVLSQRVMVGDGARGTQLQAADLTLDDFRGLESCHEIRPDVIEDEIRSAAIWLTVVTITLPTGSASCRSRAPRSPRGSVSIAAVSWASRRRSGGDDVDFAGREALQRFRVRAGIRHARQSQGRLPLRKECT